MKFCNLVKILIITLVLSFSVTVKAATIEKITVDKLVSTINTGTVTTEIKNMYKSAGDSTGTVTAVKTSAGLEVTFKSKQGNGTIPFTYNAANNSLSYTLDTTSTSEEAMVQVAGAAYMTAWLYEASQYADETVLSKLIGKTTNDGNVDIKETNCNIAVDAICGISDKENKKSTVQFLMSDLYAQKINQGYGINTNASTTNTTEESTSSKKVKNPNTGAFADLVAISSVTLLSIVSVIIIKRNNKFYRI